MLVNVVSAATAAALVPDGGVVATCGSGGGVLEPDVLLAAIEQRFTATGRPGGLTLVHALGLGDRGSRGTNRFAHPGMIRRVIGGHWSWSPRMVSLARDNAIEAYAWPSGAISLLLREIGARRPGLITRTGLGTFVDPRLGGGRLSPAAAEDLVELVTFDGEEYLRYKPFSVDIGIIRGAVADDLGNISCTGEAALLDALAVAQAAKASGGRVLAQVRRVMRGRLDPWAVHIPGVLVDVVVEAADQRPTYEVTAASSSDRPPGGQPSGGRLAGGRLAGPVPVRVAVARRAAQEVSPGDVLNVGFGMSAGVIDVLAEQGRLADVRLVVEQGLFDGTPATGDLFGAVADPSAVVPSTTAFDMFAGGLLDIACLGMAQVDATGAVNVSMIDGAVVGPGGFVDISQNARRVVFCGTFTAKGLRAQVEPDGRLTILREGAVPKFVGAVDQVSFSGRGALKRGQRVTYVTERAVFQLTAAGLELTEYALGVDLERDVLGQMGFRPGTRQARQVPAGRLGQELTRVTNRAGVDG